MGARGRNAQPTNRAAHRNARPNARQRLKVGWLTVDSNAYWDVVLGADYLRSIGREPHWSDPFDPEREEAWRLWRDGIFRRFSTRYGNYGGRPAAWFAFDLPDPGDLDVAGMSHVEIVYHLDADATERAQIEEAWQKALDNAAHFKPGASYAPAMFAKDPAAKGATKQGLTAAMNRLFSAGKIAVEKVGPASRQVRCIVATGAE